MIPCQKCKRKFPFLMEVDGTKRNLSGRKFCLDCSPFGKHNTSKKLDSQSSIIDKLSNKEFHSLIEKCFSRTDVFFELNMRKSGNSFSILNRRIKRDNIDVSNFQMGCHSGKNRKYSDKDV